MVGLKSLSPSIAGVFDKLWLGHLKDLDAPPTAVAGRRLLRALANLCQSFDEAKYFNMLTAFFS